MEIRVIVVICAFCGNLACGGKPPAPARAEGELVGHHAQSAATLLVISDTHASNPMAPHQLRTNNASADARVGAAMRPPQLELWGLRILEYILERPQRPRVVLHLGDAANIACKGELSRFLDVMKQEVGNGETGTWLMAPGNHDTLVMGNWAYEAEAPPTDPHTRPNAWNRECGSITPGGEMDKSDFFQAYVLAKGGSDPRPDAYEPVPGNANYRCSDIAMAGGIKARECRGDNVHARYAWFLVQSLDLDASTQVIVLDTTEYRSVPAGRRGLLDPGGVLGGVSDVQLQQAERLIDPKKNVILAGHFPIESLDPESRARLMAFLAREPVVSYLSGHVHAATNARMQDVQGKPQFLELNFGAVAGWPMEYSYLDLRRDASNRLVLTLDTIDAATEQYAQCLEDWPSAMERPGNPAFYTDYKRQVSGTWVSTYATVRQAMFSNMLARFEHPSEPDLSGATSSEIEAAQREIAAMKATAVAMRTFGWERYMQMELTTGHRPRTFPGLDPDAAERLEKYERCQAIWASEAEGVVGSSSSWWKALPGIRAVIAHYDDPQPANAFRLRSAAVARETWRWYPQVSPERTGR